MDGLVLCGGLGCEGCTESKVLVGELGLKTHGPSLLEVADTVREDSGEFDTCTERGVLVLCGRLFGKHCGGMMSCGPLTINGVFTTGCVDNGTIPFV